jgi:hypothetical protein
MPGTLFLVDANARLSFSHDWDPWLAKDETGAVVETIDSRQWTIVPQNPGTAAGPTLSNDQSDVCFVENLLPGRIYHLTETVVTSASVRDERTIVLRVAQT